VATRHWGLLAAELERLAVAVDESAALGLTRVALPDVERVAALFEDELRRPVVLPGQNAVLLPETALDQVLAGLRVRFASRHSGWFPTFGKNREVVGGVGNPIYIARFAQEPRPEKLPAVSSVEGRNDGSGIRIGVLDTPDPGPVPVSTGETAAGTGTGTEAGTGTGTGTDQATPFWKGHGTFVQGLIRQQAPAAQILLNGVLSGDRATASSWDVAKALVAMDDVELINLSLACLTADNQPPLVLQAAIDALPPETLVVAAAGNYEFTDGPRRYTPPAWPAAMDRVLAVGSSGEDGTRSRFSPDEPWVARTERGEDLVSAYLTGKVVGAQGQVLGPFSGGAVWSGTSFAAAVFSGRLAALAGRRGCSVREALTSLPGTP